MARSAEHDLRPFCNRTYSGPSSGRSAAAGSAQEANLLAQCNAQIALDTHRAGGSAVLENPRNVYYWLVPGIAALRTSGFQDFDNYSCAWGGARCKKQRLRSNCSELQLVQTDRCVK
eukprot:1367422-Amphidinium_carterae.1